MGAAYVDFALENPSHYRVMFGGFVEHESRDPELDTEATAAFEALVDALSALQADSVVRNDDTVLMASHVWALVHGVAMLAVDGQLREPGEVRVLLRYSVDRLLTGIATER